MSLFVSLYVAILFFILTPGILVTLPPKSGRYTVAFVHALVFSLIFYFTYNIVWRIGVRMY
jgi:hypothetical protein